MVDDDGGGGPGALRELMLAAPAETVVEPTRLRVVPRYSPYARWIKPVMDRAGAAILLTALLPILAAVAVVVLIRLGRPVFFLQPRIGLNGRVFGMFKFRTMRPDRRFSDTVVHMDRRLTHKHPEDPRLVPVGRFLRRWSLDELPQLINVMRGDMSLVGPRPEMASVVSRHYEPWQHARHQVKPGITGLWQVTERDCGDEMYKHTDTDLRYVQRMSFALDMKILLLTLPTALGLRKGF